MSKKITMAKETGLAGRETSEAMQNLWARADAMNDERELPFGEEYSWEYVPVRAIEVREDIQPRDGTSQEAIERYAETFDDLPPALVQAETFVLIDGRQRLEAAALAGKDHIKASTVVIEDADLFLRAVEENSKHGLPLTATERLKAGRKLLALHPDMDNVELAKQTGIPRQTIWRWKEAKSQPAPATAKSRAAKEPPTNEPTPRPEPEPDEPVTATAAPASGISHPAFTAISRFTSVVSNYDPEASASAIAGEDIPKARTEADAARTWLKRYRFNLLGERAGQ